MAAHNASAQGMQGQLVQPGNALPAGTPYSFMTAINPSVATTGMNNDNSAQMSLLKGLSDYLQSGYSNVHNAVQSEQDLYKTNVGAQTNLVNSLLGMLQSQQMTPYQQAELGLSERQQSLAEQEAGYTIDPTTGQVVPVSSPDLDRYVTAIATGTMSITDPTIPVELRPVIEAKIKAMQPILTEQKAQEQLDAAGWETKTVGTKTYRVNKLTGETHEIPGLNSDPLSNAGSSIMNILNLLTSGGQTALNAGEAVGSGGRPPLSSFKH
jgi:hypothetical protein